MNSQDKNLHRAIYKSGIFFWKTSNETLQKPKQFCLDEALEKGCEFVVEQQYGADYNPAITLRRFGYFENLDMFLKDYGDQNGNFFEVASNECKLYLDLEWKDDEPDSNVNIAEYVKTKLIPHYRSVYPDIPINEADVYICCASGMGDKDSTYFGKFKHSFHLVVNNGYYFKNTKEAKYFAESLRTSETNETLKKGIDISPYGKNQSFKLPYQSKWESERVQLPLNGIFENHLIGKYSSEVFKGYYPDAVVENFTKERNSTKKPSVRVVASSSFKTLDVGRIITDKHLTEADLKDVKSMLAFFDNDDVHWDTYFAIGCIVKNEGYDFADFDTWCMKSTKYKKHEVLKEWNRIDKREDQEQARYTQNTLRNLLKRKFPNEQNERVLARFKNKFVDQVSKPTIDFAEYGYDTVIYNERYCQPLAQQFIKYDDIQLHSHLGTGKTTVICDLIREGNFNSIVCITPRVAFAHSIHASLKQVEDRFVLYKDIPRAERHKERFIVCQMESIHTLDDAFDLVIFDESESNLAQLDSKTIVNVDRTTWTLEQLMKNAKKTIWSDAFVLDRSLVICAKLRPHTRKLYIKNTHQPYDRKAWKVGATSDEFLKFIKAFQAANPGKRLVIATGSKINSDKIENELKDGCRVLKINSYTSDALTRSLQDVNEVWSKVDVVVYTTSITVGISYDDPNKPFDFLFLHFSCCSSTVRDLFQSSLRAREITQNTLYYSNYSHYNDGDCFAEFSREGLRTIVEKRYEKQGVKVSPWLIDLWCFTKQEKNCNAFLHEDIIDEYLRICGYTSENLVPKRQDQRDLRKVQIDEAFEDNDYVTIAELTKGEFKAVDLLIKKGEAEKIHKQQRKKYEFDHYMLIDKSLVSAEVRATMFYEYVRNSDKIDQTKKNVFAERSFSETGEILNTPCIYVNNLKEKVERIAVLTKLLGVDHSYDKAFITHENLDATAEYVQANLAEMGPEWFLDLRRHVPNDNKTKKTLGVLNQILGKWGFQEIVRGVRKRKTCKDTGERVDVSNYELRTQAKYSAFNEFCLNKKD